MQKKALFFSFLVLFLYIPLSQSAITIDKINKVSSIIKESTTNISPQKILVVWDIDDTLANITIEDMKPYQWFRTEVNTKKKEGADQTTAEKEAISKLFSEKTIKKVELIEDASDVIENMKNLGFIIIGLTGRFPQLYKFTQENLNSLGINFSHKGLPNNFMKLSLDHPCNYESGIISSGNNDKGKSLLQFLKHEQVAFQPKVIIFIDDKMKNGISVETACKTENITCIAIHYQRKN